MVGRSRIERCSKCRVQLLVPPLTWTVRCAVCHAITDFRPPKPDPPFGRLHGHARHVKGWVKGLISDFSSTLLPPAPNDSFNSSSSSSYGYRYGSTAGMGWPASYPAVRRRKRAVLCGVSYATRLYELKGTVNDVNCVRFLLVERFGFSNDSIIVLTEEERDPYRIPTKDNMRAAMRWLIHGCQAGDSLVFHFSGHGVQKLDTSGNEVDGLNEALCPLDYESRGLILDDEVNAVLVRPLPPGAKLHALVDACHSGTALDLPFLCRINRTGFYQWEDHSPPSGEFRGTNGGLAICISGCDDHQTSADTMALSGSATTGAMTYSFIHAVESEPGTTYGRILTTMRTVIRGADTGIHVNGPITSLLKRVFKCGLTQEPQLSSSEMFDIYKKPFLL